MQPFLHGRKVASAPPLRPPASRPTLPRAAADAAGCGPHVEVIKEGDKVVRLIVTCGCGERTEIDCLYSGG
ncbi:MAG: hypothetical protein JNG83_06595 [Opitutaceae bacterium]|nr:hypothetical protein [Opitutaceae bacterium]